MVPSSETRGKTCKPHQTASSVLVVGADKEGASGLTPLHAAALSGNVDCIKTLLAAKASVSAVSDDGRSAIPIMPLLCISKKRKDCTCGAQAKGASLGRVLGSFFGGGGRVGNLGGPGKRVLGPPADRHCFQNGMHVFVWKSVVELLSAVHSCTDFFPNVPGSILLMMGPV